ncbi:SWIM zinc finger protein [Aneurinibacillus soli]|uniref:ATP-dependent helicase HepA n=1 Tax=Aneurinibacillus soli TaxID=1500254 RepID=A0A0U5AWI0_9BACL|nr:DEAD/DEAH box helicase [Aneurinibacillus soli]PYE61229.1 SWIM zinc finger protein [Aneurinibacillus soli]BAU26336.1 ATP-dependent helicase HepA [Aneurinibacillus soli]
MSGETSFITTQFVKKWCGSNAFYQRGLSYYQHGRVTKLHFDSHERVWHAVVIGSDDYDVEVYIEDSNIDARCTCPAYNTSLSCKHIVAVLLEIQEVQLGQGTKPETKKSKRPIRHSGEKIVDLHKYQQANHLLTTWMNMSNPVAEVRQAYGKHPLMIEYVCNIHTARMPGNGKLLSIELRAGMKRPYVVKKIGEFLESVAEGSTYTFTSNFTFDSSEQYVSEEDMDVLQLLQEIQENEHFFRSQMSYYGSSDSERSLLIPPLIANRLFSKLQGRVVSVNGQENVIFQSDGEEHKLPLTFRLEKGELGEFELDLNDLTEVMFFDSYGWALQDGIFYQLTNSQKNIMRKLAPVRNSMGNKSVLVSQKQMESFVSYVMPGLKEIGQLELAGTISEQIISLPLCVKVFLDYEDETMLAKVEYHYGNIVIDAFQDETKIDGKQDVILMREMENEQEFMKIFESTPFKYNGKQCYIEGEDEIYTFLFTVVPGLEEKAELYMTNAVQSLLFPKDYIPVTRIDVEPGGNLLEISFDMGDIDPQEVQNILQSVVEKKRYYRLSDGTFVSLEDGSFDAINQLFSELHISKSQVKSGVLQLPVYRSLQIDELIGEGDKYSAKLGKKFRRLIQELKNPDMIDVAVPETLQATLRDYQNFGFQWLKTLAHYRLGGILADDMGLGKTIQTITYLLSEKADETRKTHTSLIVVPASLVYNWKSEFEKYAPDLDVAVAYGTPDERSACLRERMPDAFITSYPLLRQDIELYEAMEFDSLILDEAQAIKNHTTKTASAVKTIKAGKRFALSGTPIENSLDELWSIFDAILPGFFHNHKWFKSLENDKIARMVRPFILRRLKQDVLTELPEKIETVHQSELTKKQKELYVGYLEKIQQEAKESLETDGFQKNRMKILAGLTRLRQLCCHPSLFLENYEDASGKMEQLMEIVANALENKRRLLIFSQFTSMLAIIRQEMDRQNIGYFYLDGQTPSKDRMGMTERFNQGEHDIFLISLKAGGTGLNLTGADTVILYDLWWNPAVEEQAAGRAHRIGQKNSVQVMRLIARGTIEEKIYELQQKKKELIEQVIQPGETMLSSLSEAEIRDILGI